MVVSRPGFPVSVADHRASERAILIDAITADVSSTAIRERRALGQPIAGMVPDSVRQHIEQHGLYSPMPPDRRSAGISPSTASRVHGEN